MLKMSSKQRQTSKNGNQTLNIMTIEINKNTIISGLIGIMIGSGGTYGVQALRTPTTDNQIQGLMGSQEGTTQPERVERPTNYDRIPYDENGDVIITPTGSKYHYDGCHTLSNSPNTRRVNSTDAANAGLGPCSRCTR